MKNDDNYDEEKWGLQLLQRTTRKMLRQITSNNYGWQTRNLSSAIAGWMEVDDVVLGRLDLGDAIAVPRRRAQPLEHSALQHVRWTPDGQVQSCHVAQAAFSSLNFLENKLGTLRFSEF